MSAAQVLIVVTIVLYLAAMLLIGFYFSRKGGSGSSDAFVYGKISAKYAPANMGDGSGDLTSSIDDIRSLIG